MQDEAGGNLDEWQWNVIVSQADSEPKDQKLTVDEYKAWMEKNRSQVGSSSNSLQTMALSTLVAAAVVCKLL